MKVIVSQLAVDYQDAGSGPVMLMLHGWKDSANTFQQLVPQLASTWRVVCVDLPGFGGTEAPASDWHLADYVAFVRSFCDKLEIEPEILVGHSLGGRIVLKAVSEGVFKPERIILIASAGIAKSDSARNRAYNVVAKTGKVVTKVPPLSFWRNRLRRKLYQRAGSDYLDAGPLAQTFLNIIAEDLQPNARNIMTPTLLIWGDKDTETPAADGLTLNRLIKGSRLEFIAGAGHFVHHEQPGAVARLMTEFGSK